jgi:hypothetical protein
MKMIDLEINVDTDVLGFQPKPPARVLWDLFPSFLLHWIRRILGAPNITPRERWFLCMYFVRQTMDTLVELHNERPKYVGHSSASEPDVKPEDLN